MRKTNYDIIPFAPEQEEMDVYSLDARIQAAEDVDRNLSETFCAFGRERFTSRGCDSAMELMPSLIKKLKS
jgi:hypothetical protein